MGINKKELRYLLSATIFAFVVFGYLIPYLVSKGVENSNVYLQFFIFNIGIFCFLQLFLKSATLNSKINIAGSIGMIALFIGLDIMMPPFMVTTDGQLLSGITLSASSSDYIFGYFFSSAGLHGFILYLAVYILVPLILFLVAAKLLPNFVKHV